MKRVILGIIAMCVSLGLGLALSEYFEAYLTFPDSQKMVFIRWQDENATCGKPQKSFVSSDEYVIIDNPLCSYSSDLHEVPTVTYDELAREPTRFDNKIIRVSGRFQIEVDDPELWNSKLYMRSNDSGRELPIHFNSPWNGDVTTKIRKFIESTSLREESADVTLIITFLDASDNKSAMEINDGNPLQMTVLHVEEMKP